MTEGTKVLRLSKIAREFNIGTSTIVDFLAKKGMSIDSNPNTKLSQEAYEMLAKEFQKEKSLKDEVRKTGLSFSKRESITMPEGSKEQDDVKEVAATRDKEEEEPEEKELLIKDIKSSMVESKKPEEEKKPEPEPAEKVKLSGPKILGKMDAETLSGKAPSKKEEKPEPKAEKPVEQKKEPVAEKIPDVPAEKEVSPPEVPVEKVPEPVKETRKEKLEEQEKKEETKPAAEAPKVEKPVEQKESPQEKPVEPPVEEKKDKSEAIESQEKEKEKEKEPISEKAEKQEEEKKAEPAKEAEAEEAKKETTLKSPANFHRTEVKKLEGVTILGKMELPAPKDKSKKPVASSTDADKPKKRKRKRIRKERVQEADKAPRKPVEGGAEKKAAPKTDGPKPAPQRRPAQQQQPVKGKKVVRRDFVKPEVSDEEISRQIRETLATLSGGGKSKAAKHRKLKRDSQQRQKVQDMERAETEEKILQVTEFVSANELASLMEVPVVQIISTCMSMGLVVSINQRLDAETITIVADEFGFDVEFISIDDQETFQEEEDTPEQLRNRAPIVTVMGHVDHGKTSLLDQIRHANVIAGEAGGITQHIGAYSVQLEDGKMITFLDTPGHEAFTAMRARGAKVTDVVIIVVAADDNVMPQTIEAINHAQAAGVPLVIAINKIDKSNANVEKVKEELAKINILVEDWGGKYQSQEISAKNGVNIDKLLEKVLLEAELLDLKANPDKKASGTVIESSLDKGRGYLATILVQNGTLNIGDIVVAGNTHGRVKAMFNERNIRIKDTGPATPALILGLDGAPQAGDTFHVVKDEQEAKSITSKRQQLVREQGLRTQKHITLDEIGRRIAIGDFKELNVIIKGDVDGSVEALADSLLKLSTEEVQVNIIHKAVGPITEGDVLLASASNAIIVGFQVRPSMAARKLAENEEIDIRIYSIIYNAINEIKSAIEGMLSPEIEEKITANIEVRETFKITKVGTIAGCKVLDGKIHRNSSIRIIRDGIVVYTGYLGSLKRYKDDVKEVSAGYECGLNIDRFNDIKVGDIIEAYETIEIARKLD
ncbi:MAG: translation initiation factor IF-2 [Bacteroidetes bacterium]|nr:MAG: translation initiation factor IF-2 [Bacteroidota bacterium]